MASAYALPEHVMLRDVGDEVVLLNLDTERYFGLDDVGAMFLRAVTGGASVEDAVAALLEAFDAPEDVIRKDLDELVGKLCDAGLLETR